MHTAMLRLLAEEAAKGNKPSNTFKAGSFTLAAKEISAQFGVECHPSYTHRKHAEYLNKKIEMYDELAIVVGKDTAMGSFSKSYVDIENESDNGDNTEFVADNVEEGVVDKGKNVVESSTTGSGISKSRKRGHAPFNTDDSVLTDLFNQLKEIAMALKEINQGLVDYTTLYNEVMTMVADGYSKDMLAIAFDHLYENKKAAQGFLAKNAKLRKLWMDSFLFTQL
ncbi:hypothetical protein ACB092_11G248100 [Castanea dentata]